MSLPDVTIDPDAVKVDSPHFQILALSGGGYRGLFSARVLEKIEERSGKLIRDHFDLITGTSIGGIIAIAIACRVPAKEVREAIELNGKSIFPWFGPARLSYGARYSPSGLRNTILGVLPEGMKLLSQVPTPLVITSLELTAGSHALFVSPVPDNQDDFSLEDVALATSAAPTYFPIHSIGDRQFVDGGLVANSPELVAVNLASSNLGAEFDDIRVLSIGTASKRTALVKLRRTNRGLLFWGRHLVEATMAAQEALATDLARMLLGERYLRLDREPAPEQARKLGLDSTSRKATSTLRTLADATVDAAYGDPATKHKLMRILAHKPDR